MLYQFDGKQPVVGNGSYVSDIARVIGEVVIGDNCYIGHGAISTTMDIYCHWIPGEGRKGLGKALLGQKTVPNCVRKPHIIAYHKKRLQ